MRRMRGRMVVKQCGRRRRRRGQERLEALQLRHFKMIEQKISKQSPTV